MTPSSDTQLSVSDYLEAELAPCRLQHRQIAAAWMNSPAFGVSYPAYLIELYHLVRRHVPLLELAYARMDRSRREMRTFLEKHIEDETGHDEWILEDLRVLGHDPSDVKRSLPLSETIQEIGSQLYIIEYMRPQSFLGYVYVMQSASTPLETLRELQVRHRIDPGAMTFWSRHSEIDIDHKQELVFVLDRYLTEPVERIEASISAILGLSAYNRMIGRIHSGDFVSTFSMHN